MGADHVLDYRAKDFSLTEKNLDVVFDVAATSSYGIVKSALTRTGTYITTEPSPNAFFNQLLTGIFSPQTTRVIMVRPDAGDLQFLLRLHAAGQLQVHIQQTYPLAQASQAHTQIETGHTLGKLVLSVG
jgi:NADPH:quinone reductase-like Zn-dependent oxidoreductase